MGLQDNEFLGTSETASILYHDIFDYPLNVKEIIRWRVGKKGLSLFKKTKEVLNKDGLYCLKDKESFLYKRTLRERISNRKTEIAKKNASLLAKLPTVKGVFITGALAMNNAKEESDIDLMIITKRNRLWLTRLTSYLVLRMMNYAVRKPNDKDQKDKLCLNIWLDESALSWGKKDRNIYSAHEIAQVVPIVDKENVHQRFLQKNRWILDYWPSAVRLSSMQYVVRSMQKSILHSTFYVLLSWFNKLAFKLQYLYMKPKITREVVTLHKAIFHPRNWGKEINELLSA
ncbi:hypothetical protein COY29_04250 [Candidatus Woesebacteria bacterium CG_4_10_14_0_2_um_filter_39_14]|uniref:Polymerase nucleotidyl transferase domain-containing protein n=1 Tax=Candidatus Woesebacteria bacterium CG_4_10_14_0_2_um_filter_39_14 TaxID=1975054 RepID=A0A2M7TLR9_9BACT|nr:MAG: hypothetical protein COY29_04250 [Candidatus Woesebacteria bacterium CG_4_10_14_0_2_um_filter_39_14]